MKVVALGGGHGLSRTLHAVRQFTDDVVAVVSTADDGGSSGRLRSEFDVLPPGDLRMALLALSAPSKVDEAKLWSHRFSGDGALAGHNLGNLMLTALWQRFGTDFAGIDKGLQVASRMLEVAGRVVPVTSSAHHLVAHVETSAGTQETVEGQAHVSTTPHRIKAVEVQPRVTANAAVTAALEEADLIVLGPGSWFTSVLAVLCVDGVCEAISGSAASVAVVLNLREQAGEADGYRPHDYMESFYAHHPRLNVDAWILDSAVPSDIVADLAQSKGSRVVTGHFADDAGAHDPTRLAAALRELKIHPR